MTEFDDDLVVLYVAAGVGVAGTTIFKSSKAAIPDGDGPYLSLTPTGGAGPKRTHNAVATPAYQRPSAQIVCRAKTWTAARAMARAAYSASFVTNATVNGTWYVEVEPTQEPFDLGLDAKERACVAFNVHATKRP